MIANGEQYFEVSLKKWMGDGIHKKMLLIAKGDVKAIGLLSI